MNKLRKELILLTVTAGLIAIAGVGNVTAQRGDLRDCQRAQAKTQREYSQYLRTRSSRDYRQWQNAQRDSQRECREYRAEVRDNRNDRGYRIYRDGRYYQVDNRGVELLRRAVNSGYQQGYRAGMNDRRYRRNSNYRNSSIYRSATYGYQTYVARDQYQYYFQQGFERGYEDGYSNSFRYGSRAGSNYNILGSILNTILTIADDHN